MVRQKKLQDQMPMGFMLPETDWTAPTSLPDLTGRGALTIDLETRDDGLAAKMGSSWYRRGGYVTGVTLAVPGRSFYAPVRLPDTYCLDHDTIGDWIRHHLRDQERRGLRPRFHNASYDLGWLWAEWDIDPPDEVDDTMGMDFMLEENHLSYSLDNCCARVGIRGKDEVMLRQAAEVYGVDPKSGMWKIPGRYQAPYAEQDGTATTELAEHHLAQLESQGLMDAYQLEADLIPLTHHMRRRGVRVNTDRAERTRKRLLSVSQECLDELTRQYPIGRRWAIEDVRSPITMARVFTAEGVPFPKTEKGNDSFSNEWMSKRDHKLPQLCSRALKYHDAGEKFVGNYILGYSHMGRIYAEIHSTRDETGGTITTRFSYSDPPLQQMPSRDEDIARDIRAIFEPEEGEIWAAVDYSQQEFRLMVHYASVCQMEGADRPVAMYIDNPDTDFHNMVVDITGIPRRKAKDVNFAKAFGAGPGKFATMVGVTFDEAKEQMAEYDEKLPFVSRLAEYCQKVASQRGYIRMIDGTRGRFPRWEPRWVDREKVREIQQRRRTMGLPQFDTAPCDLDEANRRREDPEHPWHGQRLRRAFTHKAMNKLIQGSAARQMKRAMRACWRERIVPLLQMHDELDLSVGSRETAERVGEIMRDVIKLVIPVKTDIEYGVNWGRAAKEERNKVVVHYPTWENAVRDRDSGEWR